MGVYGCLNAYTLDVVHRLRAQHNFKNFAHMCQVSLGRPGIVWSFFAIFVLNWGALLASLMIIGTELPVLLRHWVKDTPVLERKLCITLLVVVVAPISYFKSVSRLNIPSLLNQLFLLIGELGVG
jgi:amino acid permease